MAKIVFLIISTLLIFCESGFVNILQKCNMSDGNCKKTLYKNIINGIATGVPDMKISPLDPIQLTAVTASLPLPLELTLIDGQVTGFKDCSYNSLTNSLEKMQTDVDLTCNITINGQYKIKGQDLEESHGKGQIFIEQVKVNVDFPFYFKKEVDGEIYLICKLDEIKHRYNTVGKTTFIGELGPGDKYEKTLAYLNENSNLLEKTFLPPAVDKAMEFFSAFVDKFFKTVPIQNIIDTDLSPYIMNN